MSRTPALGSTPHMEHIKNNVKGKFAQTFFPPRFPRSWCGARRRGRRGTSFSFARPWCDGMETLERERLAACGQHMWEGQTPTRIAGASPGSLRMATAGKRCGFLDFLRVRMISNNARCRRQQTVLKLGSVPLSIELSRLVGTFEPGFEPV
jgi:hypothetical protein